MHNQSNPDATDGVIVGADPEQWPKIMADLYGMSLIEAEEHEKAFQEALAAGRDVELGSYVCTCTYCRRVRASNSASK